MNEQPVFQPPSLAAPLAVFFGGIFLFTIFIVGVIANWTIFVATSSVFVRAIIILAGILLCLSVVGYGLYKAYMTYVKIQHAREDLLERQEERRRQNERHTTELHLLTTRIHADERGNRPFLIDPTDRTIIPVPSGNYVQPVPTHYNVQYKEPPTKVTEVPAEPTRQLPMNVQAPAMDTVLSWLKPNALQVCLGTNATTGQPFILGLEEGVHYKFIGSSGMGKSCLAASILDQVTQANDPDHLLIALLDLEHKTSRLFEHLPHVAELNVGKRRIDCVATDANEVARMLGFLRQELDRRKALSEELLRQQRFLLIYVEEFLSLRLEVDEDLKEQMLADFTILAVRGRKYGMYLLACAQDDYAETELRSAKNQFRVKGAFGVPPTAAQSAGFVMRDLVKQNYQAQTPGQFVLETRGCNALMLAPVYDLRAKLQVLHRAAPSASRGAAPFPETEQHPKIVPLYPRSTQVAPMQRPGSTDAAPSIETQVLDLKERGFNQDEIIEKVWGAKKGSNQRYLEARDAYRKIIQSDNNVLESER